MISSRDAEACERAIREHLSGTYDRLVTSFGNSGETHATTGGEPDSHPTWRIQSRRRQGTGSPRSLSGFSRYPGGHMPHVFQGDGGIVIVGGALAGGNAAVALREEGYRGRVTVIGREPGVPFGLPLAFQDLPAVGGRARELVCQAGQLVCRNTTWTCTWVQRRKSSIPPRIQFAWARARSCSTSRL